MRQDVPMPSCQHGQVHAISEQLLLRARAQAMVVEPNNIGVGCVGAGGDARPALRECNLAAREQMAHGVVLVHKHCGLCVAGHGRQPRAHSQPLGWVLRNVEA
eukprot:9974575-Alexandrium_andersonii.AAC.1